MIFKELNFVPVLLGNDINSYSLARAFYEAYGIKSIMIGKYQSGPNQHSRLIDFRVNPQLDQDRTFLEIVGELADELKGKKVLLIGCGDSYVSLISRQKNRLPSNFIAPYIDYGLMSELVKKDKFYEQCEKYGIAYPKTFIYRQELGNNFNLPFSYPVIVKPADSVAYWQHPFTNQHKVYRAKNEEEFKKIVTDIYGAGYSEALVVQDFIPGDDTEMRVLTCYSDRHGRVKLMALGHVLLEEHTPHGLGNHAAIINDYDERLLAKVKNFLEAIGYVGFSNFDLKYDQRDGEYKCFEINTRQGRSNYYVTGAGANLAKYVVEDFVYQHELDYQDRLDPRLWLVIPKLIVFKYVKSEVLQQKVRELIKNKKIVNPLFYAGDFGLKRLLYLGRLHLSHFGKYRKYYK